MPVRNEGAPLPIGELSNSCSSGVQGLSWHNRGRVSAWPVGSRRDGKGLLAARLATAHFNTGFANVPIIGIDLGTVNSVIAHLDEDQKPVTIHNAEGDLLTPSVVLFDAGEVVVGKEALKAAALEPENVAQFVKREMGEREFSKPIRGHRLPPEVVQSFVLRKLRNDASLVLGEVTQAVITVPAFFNEPRRKATQDAGRLAGLDVVDIINEPTAAAIAFGVQRGFLSPRGVSLQPEVVLVYDLGGGTFDVTLMRIEGTHFEAIGTAGDVYLGGIDWDNALADHVAAEFQRQFGVDPREDTVARQRLLQDAEDAKRALSQRSEATIPLEYGGKRARFKVTRSKFEELTAALLDRSRFTTAKVLREANIAWSDLTRILLVGGSTRMPMVHAMLEKESGLKPDRSISPDEAVAHGASIYAGMLSTLAAGERPRLSVTNVNSHNLGVLGLEPATGRPRNRVLIARNSPLPATHRKKFKTFQDNQPNVAVRVVEGGDASGNQATHIGKCVVHDLPRNLPKGTPVEVSFSYTTNGRLLVEATLPSVHRSATLEIQRIAGLSEEDLLRWQQLLLSDDWLQALPPAKEPLAAAPVADTFPPRAAASPKPHSDQYQEEEYDDDDEEEYEDDELEDEYEEDEYEDDDEYDDDEYEDDEGDDEDDDDSDDPPAEKPKFPFDAPAKKEVVTEDDALNKFFKGIN